MHGCLLPPFTVLFSKVQLAAQSPHLPQQLPCSSHWKSKKSIFAFLNMAAVNRKFIYTTSAPAAIGPYSQGVLVDRTMYISGQIGMDVATGQLVEGGVQAQTKQALTNMGEILKAGGCSYNNVVKTTVLLKDINDFNSVNEVYSSFFSSNFPARAAYQVAALPRGALVEIEAIAALGPISDS